MSSGEGRGGEIVKATIAPVTDDAGSPLPDAEKRAQAVTVHFNPESLDISLSNNFTKGTGDSPVQLVDEASEQLSLELQFDTTTSGVDVRQDTGRIAAFLKPLDMLLRAGRNKRLPPPKVVEFEWGAIVFQGYIDSYSETLDYFSSDGIPLRAKVSLSLTHQERSFEPQSRENPDAGQQDPFSGAGNDPFGGDAVDAPIALDAPIDNAAAAANGIENARLPGTDVLALPTSGGFGGSLGGSLGSDPAAFASAGVGLGAGLGVGAGAGASLDVGVGVDIGASAGAGLGLGAGVGGTAAAFAGLSVKPPKLELQAVSVAGGNLQARVSTTGPVAVGGAVKAEAGASFRADVSAKITFGEG